MGSNHTPYATQNRAAPRCGTYDVGMVLADARSFPGGRRPCNWRSTAMAALVHGDVRWVRGDADGQVIAQAHNERELTGDPTAHAEVLALRSAASVVGHWRLARHPDVTLEPCTMCAGAVVNARVGRLVFGATDPKAGAVRSLYEVADDPRLNHRAIVEGGVLAGEAGALLREFFAARRR